jgi:flagellar biosynthesis/type III secretory pathway M-ring protein FliF/YscJ
MLNKVTVWNKNSTRVWIVFGACCLLVLSILFVLKMLPRFRYENLISSNSAYERTQIENALKGANIPWKVNGSFIEVPSKYKNRTYIIVAVSGLEKQGQIKVNAKR